MHQEMQIVNPLVYMPMPQIPRLVVKHLLNGVQPVLRTVVHGRLVDSWQEALCRNILIRAGVGEYHIHMMCLALLLNIFLDRRSRLFVWPPLIPLTKAIEFVNAISTADHKTPFAFDVEDISVNRKQDIREVLFIQNTAAVLLHFLIGADILWSVLMVAVDAEKSGFQE